MLQILGKHYNRCPQLIKTKYLISLICILELYIYKIKITALKRHTSEEEKFISIPNILINSLPNSVTMNINWEKHREVGQQEVSNAGEIKNKYCGLKKSIFSFLVWNRLEILIAIAVFNQISAWSFFWCESTFFQG